MAASFPLGPGEVYRPGPNVRYVNQGVVGAVTVVPRDAFVGARPVSRTMMAAPRETMQAQVVGSTAPLAPVRESVLARPVGGAAVRTPPARVADRAVFAKTAPPAPRVYRVEGLRPAGPGGRPAVRPAVVRGPGAGVARPERQAPAMAPERSDRSPAVRAPLPRSERPTTQAPATDRVDRPPEQPRSERPAQMQERNAEAPKSERKGVGKTEKKEERK